MSGVSDISCRALVMYGSSAEVEAHELIHSATNAAEITSESISDLSRLLNAPLFFVPKRSSLLAHLQVIDLSLTSK